MLLNDRARFCNRSEPRASARAVSQYAARCTIAHGHLGRVACNRCVPELYGLSGPNVFLTNHV